MSGDEVQVSARISFAQRDAIRAHGGLVHLIRKFLTDNSTEALASREDKKCESDSQKKQETELRLLKKRRGLHQLKTPKEWERANKLYYLMQYAITKAHSYAATSYALLPFTRERKKQTMFPVGR